MNVLANYILVEIDLRIRFSNTYPEKETHSRFEPINTTGNSNFLGSVDGHSFCPNHPMEFSSLKL